MNSIFDTYQNVRKSLREVSEKRENNPITGLVSTILAIIIMIGPMVVLGNCIIFNDFMILVLIGFIACIMLIVYLSRVFYFLAISQKEVKHLGTFFAVEGMIFLIVFIAIACLVYFL